MGSNYDYNITQGQGQGRIPYGRVIQGQYHTNRPLQGHDHRKDQGNGQYTSQLQGHRQGQYTDNTNYQGEGQVYNLNQGQIRRQNTNNDPGCGQSKSNPRWSYARS